MDPDRRTAHTGDLEGLTAVLTGAFASDPVWGRAFPDPAERAEFWRFLAGSALRFPATWIAGDFDAVAVWIPPGEVELTEAEEEHLEPMLTELMGERAAAVIETVERFDANHPKDRGEHFYLSLLGTHPEHRGHGYGMGLLRENLAEMDAAGIPSYLESTNPDNNARYERLGYEQIGEFTVPYGDAPVANMWRDPSPKQM